MDLFKQLSKKPALLNASDHQFELCFTDIERAPMTPELVKQLIQDYKIDSRMARALIRFIRHAISEGKSDTLLFEAGNKHYLLAIYLLENNKFVIAAHDLDISIVNSQTSPADPKKFNLAKQSESESQLVKAASELPDSINFSDNTSMSFLAFHDPLTFLPNRTLAIDRLKQSVVNSEREQLYYSLIFIDVDDFKLINDSLGHNVGDEVLKAIADRLSSNVRAKDTVARLGGDEFLIILSSLDSSLAKSTEVTNNIVTKLSSSLTKNIVAENNNITASVSIGITMFKGQEHDVKNLMQQADMAMYQAKGNLKGSFEFFSEVMRHKLLAAVALEKDLNQALTRNEFQLYFQPKVTDAYQLIGAEALLRWQHPTKGLIYPKAFIAELENSSHIFDFGYWLIGQACEVLASWQQIDELSKCHLSINISAKHFNDDEFSDKVAKLLNLHQVPKNLLIFEITETLLLENIDKAIAQLNKLTKLGVKFSIDDFGTGYSSLLYLKQLPIHEVKIDRSFIQNIVNDKADEMIVKTIVNLANNFQLSLIAEGVEHEEQVTKLTQLGCYQFQGFLFSKAISNQGLICFAQQISKRQALLKNAESLSEKTSFSPTSYVLSQFNYWIERNPSSKISMLVCHIKNMHVLDAALGLTVTEEVLERAVKRLLKVLPNKALIAQQQRGDFMILLSPEDSNIINSSSLAMSIVNIVKRPILINGLVVHLEPEVEISQYPKDGENADVIAQRLLSKVIKVPESIENRQSQELVEMLQLQQEFKSSFASSMPDLVNGQSNSEFEVCYQPVVRLGDGEIAGVEVTTSWLPEGVSTEFTSELFPPGEDHLKVLNTLTLWATQSALNEFSNKQLDNLEITIPVQAEQLESDNAFIDKMCSIVASQQTSKRSIRLELHNLNAQLSSTLKSAVAKLKDAGVNLGLSSPHLPTLCNSISQRNLFDYVKLKKHKSKQSDHKSTLGLNQVTVEAFSKMFQIAGIKPVMSGVDSLEEVKELKLCGVMEAQGNVYSQPMLFERFVGFLSQHNKNLHRE